MKKIVDFFLFSILLFCFSFIIVMGWQVDTLKVVDSEGLVFYETVLPAFVSFDTSYIHSVEQTEVQDTYVVTCGKMWSWEERTKSLKAGMPQQAPRCGRFFMTNDWLVYQGGRLPWNKFYYRIGNAILGRNKASFPYLKEKKLYEIFPNKRIVIAVEKKANFLSQKYPK